MSRSNNETDPLVLRTSSSNPIMVGTREIIHNQQHRRRQLLTGLLCGCVLLGSLSFVGNQIWLYLHRGDDEDHGTALVSPPAKIVKTTAVDLLNARNVAVDKGCETTLLLMRHCEKVGPLVVDADGHEHCSYLGQQRSYYIASLFASHQANQANSTTQEQGRANRWPAPAHLFALTTNRKQRQNFREYETLLPLSRKVHLETELVDKSPSKFSERYVNLIETRSMCGKIAVVCWKHEYLVKLAAHLGCTTKNGCPDRYDEHEYDEVWQLKYVYHPRAPKDYDDEEDAIMIDGDGREFRHKRWRRRKREGWIVYGSKVKQHFDPLSHSYLAGDYPDAGKPYGGAWRTLDEL